MRELRDPSSARGDAAGAAGCGRALSIDQKSRTRYISPAAFLPIYLGLDDLDSAFQELARGIEERSSLVTVLHVAPIAEPLRNDPRYQRYAEQIGFPIVP